MLLKPGKSKHLPDSYRPISLTSGISKIYETIIKNRLARWFDETSKLSAHQYGFQPRKNTVYPLMKLTENIIEGFNKRKHTLGIYIDFQKAFDNVWTPKLIEKCHLLGIPNCYLKFIKQFMTGRNVKVYRNGATSPTRILKNGVPQGCCLSPLLFLIYINSLPNYLGTSVHTSLFADDLFVTFPWKSVSIAQDKARTILNRIENWSKIHKIPINYTKTAIQIFSMSRKMLKADIHLSINGNIIKKVDKYKLLGITLDSKLKFSDHIQDIVEKVNSRTRILKLLSSKRWGSNIQNLNYVWNQYILPIITYASPAWYHTLSPSRREVLEKLVYRVARITTGCLSSTPLPYLLKEAGLLKIEDTVDLKSCKIMLKIEQLEKSSPLNLLSQKRPTIRLKTKKGWREWWKRFNNIYNLNTKNIPYSPPSSNLLTDYQKYLSFRTLNENKIKTDLKPKDIITIKPQVKTICDISDFWVFSDGSVKRDKEKTGIGLVIKNNLKNQQLKIANSFWKNASSFDTEIYAIYESLKIIESSLEKNSYDRTLKLSIFTDSFATVTTLQKYRFDSNEIKNNIISILYKLGSLKNIQTTIIWIPAHMGIINNEEADTLANIGSNKQNHKNHPETSSHVYKSLQIKKKIQHLLPNKTNELYSKLNKLPLDSTLQRYYRVILRQLRAKGHSMFLKKYQKRISKSDSSSCPNCKNTIHDLEHVLKQCKLFEEQRSKIFKGIPCIEDLWLKPRLVACMFWGV